MYSGADPGKTDPERMICLRHPSWLIMRMLLSVLDSCMGCLLEVWVANGLGDDCAVKC